MRYYTSALKAKKNSGKEYIANVEKFFDETVVPELQSGTYKVDSNGITILSTTCGIENIMLGNVTTKYGSFCIKGIQKIGKAFITMMYCRDREIVADMFMGSIVRSEFESNMYFGDSYADVITALYKLAEDCNIGIVGSSCPCINNTYEFEFGAIVNDFLQIPIRDISFINNDSTMSDSRQVQFDFGNVTFDFEFDMNVIAVRIPYYLYKLFAAGLKKAIADGSLKDVIIMDQKILNEITCESDGLGALEHKISTEFCKLCHDKIIVVLDGFTIPCTLSLPDELNCAILDIRLNHIGIETPCDLYWDVDWYIKEEINNSKDGKSHYNITLDDTSADVIITSIQRNRDREREDAKEMFNIVE